MDASFEPFPRETHTELNRQYFRTLFQERFRSAEMSIRLRDGRSNFRNFDNVCVDTMRHGLKAAAVASEASLFTRLTLRATMTIDTLNVITF